ncbi:2-oxoglutarate and iron-dependent oxygenase domain-containing protein 2 isoform X3 [Rhipicephalus microplus]|uniref:2-oxoglutarate and iron-dependent oxygenase domain-containing protein 2 isoform X3 n=1 Tax=Rhipicephalus microplus TaxID=6941 RepID=UPI003F6AAE30
MKKQKFYRCACYLSSDIPVPELDMRINYFGQHAFMRQFGEALNRYGYTSREQQEAIIKRVETTVFSRMNDVKEAQHSREKDDQDMCYIPFDEEVYKFKTVLSEVGFDEQFVTPLRDQYLSPLCRALFPRWTGARFDSHNAFAVRSEPGNDSGLEFHYDNAEVTLNVCLGRRGFSGGELYFSDMREEPLDQCSSTMLQKQTPCHAFLHRGQQLRGTLSTLSGENVNLVVWLRSSEMRNRRCPLCDHVPTLVAAGEGYGDGFTARSASQESAVLKFPKFPLHRLTSSSEQMQPIDAQAQ